MMADNSIADDILTGNLFILLIENKIHDINYHDYLVAIKKGKVKGERK